MPKERTFKNPFVLQGMIQLRLHGWSLDDLAFIFYCDKTSVRKACLRNGIPPKVHLLPRPNIIFNRAVYDFDGERINQGYDYKDYIRIRKQRSQLKSPSLHSKLSI